MPYFCCITLTQIRLNLCLMSLSIKKKRNCFGYINRVKKNNKIKLYMNI